MIPTMAHTVQPLATTSDNRKNYCSSHKKRRRAEPIQSNCAPDISHNFNNTGLDVSFPGEFTLVEQPGSAPVTLSNVMTGDVDERSTKRKRRRKNSPKDSTELALSSVPPQPTPSLSLIKNQAHILRLGVQEKLTAGTGTEDAYPRHVKSYEKFWKEYQDSEKKKNPDHVCIDAHPIVGEKVSLFLAHESSRRKRDNHGRELEGTSVGKEHIKQVISALQRYMRSHQHDALYRDCPETQIPLRNQDWVKLYETAASANEPTRIKQAHTMKTKGTGADAYTTEEVIRMSMWLLEEFGSSKLQILKGLRDRAMLLLATNVAFRGDSTRRVLWSDLFTQLVPMPSIGHDIQLPALVILADQAKTNKTGRVDEHGLFRHRVPELCGFGGLAFYLFGYFHVMKNSPPEFAPDFEDPLHSEFGRRDWYSAHLFPGKPSKDGINGLEPMSYENHRERVLNMHTACNILITAVTHAPRSYTAVKARKYGAPGLEIKSLGNWRTGDAYSEIYDRALPSRAMLASALFNAEEPRTYVLPRAQLAPPQSLLSELFPWVETEQDAYEGRLNKFGKKATDHSLRHLLELMIYLRIVLLQDAAVLYQKYPDLTLWKYAPFNQQDFHTFSKESCAVLEKAELEATEHLKRLPDQLASTLRGVVQSMNIQHRLDNDHLNMQLKFMQELLSDSQSRKRSRSSSMVTMSRSSSSESEFKTRSNSPTRADLKKSQEARSLRFAVPPDLKIPPTMSPRQITNPVFPSNLNSEPLVLSGLSGSESLAFVNTGRPSSSSSELLVIVDTKWPQDLVSLKTNFLLSDDDKERSIQLEAIRELVSVFGMDKVKRHQFEWSRPSKPSIPSEWLPFYTFDLTVKTITDIWNEWSEGLGGRFSIQQLNNRWAARWRRQNEGQKTEAARRKTIITLVTDLSQKSNWTVDLALRFLQDKYPVPSGSSGPKHLSSTRSFITYLQNSKTGKANREEIFQKASVYTKTG